VSSPEGDPDYSWLTIRKEPWSEVIEKWKNTFYLRENMHYTDVEDFFNKWPILNDLKSKELVI